MHIIWGSENAKKVDSKYFVLELDTFYHEDKSIICYVALGPADIPLNSWANIEEHKKVHENLVKNYKDRNFQYCEEVVPLIRGKFGKDVDEFYDILTEKCSLYLTS
jgi:hypothetical protein